MVDRLNDQEVEVVDGFVEAILTEVPQQLTPGSWLASQEWGDAFRARLQGHHAMSEEPLSRTQFEAAFNQASEVAGWTVSRPPGPIQRFFDTTVTRAGRQRRISLKASSARDMRRGTVHISKLTEAAWIQDARRQADRRDEIVRLFQEYRSVTDCIIMLRGFRQDDGRIDYELVEVPTDIFANVDQLRIADAQPATISVLPDAEVFRIRVDRSDAKITLTGIRIEACTIHGTWQMSPPGRGTGSETTASSSAAGDVTTNDIGTNLTSGGSR